MVDAAPLLTGIGIIISFIGTYILALPELDRDYRQRFYRNAPYLRKMNEIRNQVGQWSMGTGFTVEENIICYTFVDQMYHPDSEIREETPICVESSATELIFHYSDGGKEQAQLGNTEPRIALYRTLSLVLDRRCRQMGVAIAFTGALIAIVGAVL